jgi:hypothetical protein
MKTRKIKREIGLYRYLNDPMILKKDLKELKTKKKEVKYFFKYFGFLIFELKNKKYFVHK